MSLLSQSLDALENAIAITATVDADETRRALNRNLMCIRGNLVALAQLGELQATAETRAECVRRHLSIAR